MVDVARPGAAEETTVQRGLTKNCPSGSPSQLSVFAPRNNLEMNMSFRGAKGDFSVAPPSEPRETRILEGA
jgi:hypothetical protein